MHPEKPAQHRITVGTGQLLALLFLTLAWGCNWPVAKLGVSHMAPLYIRALGTADGVVVLFCYACLRRTSLQMPRRHWLRVALLALPNMVLWYALVSIALVRVPA